MKKPHHPFLIIAAALSTSLASAQNPPGQPPPPQDRREDFRRPDGERPPRPEDGGPPEGRDFRDDRPGGPMLRDRLKNAPPRPQTPQPYIGVVTRPLEPALGAQLGITPGLGLIVEDIMPDGPAAKSGLQAMDVIKQLNDQLVGNPEHLAALVRHFGKDADVTLLVQRKGAEQKIALKIGERLMAEPAPFRSVDLFGGMRVPGAGNQEFGRPNEGPRRDGENSFRGPRNPPNGPDGPPPRPSDDRFREGAPGGPPPRAESFQNQTGTTRNTATARATLKDANGEIELRSDNGKRTLTAKNPKGEKVFDGPIDTEEQRKSVPAEFRKMLEQVEAHSRPGPP